MKRMNLYLLMIVSLFISYNELKSEDTVRFDVMYFHATIRCEGCLTIEEFVKNSLNSNFEKELKSGLITLASFDFLQEANEHYQDDYKFDVQTLIVSKKVNGKEVEWKNLELIWDYSNDFEKFNNYVIEEIKNFMENEELKDEY